MTRINCGMAPMAAEVAYAKLAALAAGAEIAPKAKRQHRTKRTTAQLRRKTSCRPSRSTSAELVKELAWKTLGYGRL